MQECLISKLVKKTSFSRSPESNIFFHATECSVLLQFLPFLMQTDSSSLCLFQIVIFVKPLLKAVSLSNQIQQTLKKYFSVLGLAEVLLLGIDNIVK